ncbi:MAG TPA: shikimate kinase [Chitinophagaceae bacterium]|nr:shikimate kinase [Chitinophagaceae bacterium]
MQLFFYINGIERYYMQKKIFLVGMMGSGKTYWADKLAQQYNMQSFHLDDVIEAEERKSISHIFQHQGEHYFRELERDCLRKFEGEDNCIVSTGGGTPCFHSNMQWMNDNGITIWIDESVDVLAWRLQKEKEHRPLISNLDDAALKNFLEEKLEERKTFYSLAKHRLHGTTITEENFKAIIESNE